MVPIPGTSQQFCQWNCDNCGAGTVFPDGCVKADGPQVCDDGYEYDSQRWGGACCPQQTSGIEGYGGTASCDIELPPSCMDGIDNDGDHYVDGNDPGCICPSPIVVDTAGDGFDLCSSTSPG